MNPAGLIAEVEHELETEATAGTMTGVHAFDDVQPPTVGVHAFDDAGPGVLAFDDGTPL